MLVNYGVLGLVAYYSFYVFLIYKLWIIKVDETKIRDFFLAFMICLIPLEMGIVSYNMYFVHIFISLVSVLLHMRQVKENRNGAFIRNAK
jgi:hypothetical protein